MMKKKKIKQCRCSIEMLEGTDLSMDVDMHTRGRDLYTKVCSELKLDGANIRYFALTFVDSLGNRNWIKLKKKILRHNFVLSLTSDGIEQLVLTFTVKLMTLKRFHLVKSAVVRHLIFLDTKSAIDCGRLHVTSSNRIEMDTLIGENVAKHSDNCSNGSGLVGLGDPPTNTELDSQMRRRSQQYHNNSELIDDLNTLEHEGSGDDVQLSVPIRTSSEQTKVDSNLGAPVLSPLVCQVEDEADLQAALGSSRLQHLIGTMNHALTPADTVMTDTPSDVYAMSLSSTFTSNITNNSDKYALDTTPEQLLHRHKQVLPRDVAERQYLELAAKSPFFGIHIYRGVIPHTKTPYWIGIGAFGIRTFDYLGETRNLSDDVDVVPQYSFSWRDIESCTFSDTRFTVDTHVGVKVSIVMLTYRVCKMLLDICNDACSFFLYYENNDRDRPLKQSQALKTAIANTRLQMQESPISSPSNSNVYDSDSSRRDTDMTSRTNGQSHIEDSTSVGTVDTLNTPSPIRLGRSGSSTSMRLKRGGFQKSIHGIQKRLSMTEHLLSAE